MQDQLKAVHTYHALSKHDLGKYAKGPDSLDWDLQPNPFREFTAAERISLPLTAETLDYTLHDILTPDAIPGSTFTLQSIGQFLQVSMGLSAWKISGNDRWPVRCNPSSGNLHPTETYLVCNTIEQLTGGVYHYQSHDHCLEQRCDLAGHTTVLDEVLDPDSMIVGLSSIYWRESWKYGVRAYRYCQLDVGHAIAALRYAAALQGWHVEILEQSGDDQIIRVLGLDRQADFQDAEQETPDVLLLVHSNPDTDYTSPDIEKLASIAQAADWYGKANILSPQGRLRWPEINQVSQACAKPAGQATSTMAERQHDHTVANHDVNASQLFRQRRSAIAFDGQTVLSATNFFQILAAISPDTQSLPFDCWQQAAHIHPVFYIHRVEGLNAGLYALPRSEQGLALMKEKFRDQFEWQKPEQCPDDIPLYSLVKAKCQNAAKTLSCHQDIASHGAFAVSMLAEFDAVITGSPWQYRSLYYEAGLLGQALYIEAEAIGARGTGIGCFFDDKIHETLGIKDQSLQCLYNFTVGTSVLDNRIISLPPYSHLKQHQE
jgi:SagB-type dehydrogenase family enzyme